MDGRGRGTRGDMTGMSGWIRMAWTLLLLGALAGCNRIIAPPPTRLAEDSLAPLPTLGPSVLDAPIRLDLSTALGILDSALPDRFGNLKRRVRVPSNKRASFAFEVERERFKASFRGDTILLSTLLHYRGRAWYNPPLAPEVTGSCGIGSEVPRARVVVRIHARITSDWQLETKSRLGRLTAATDTERDQCKVTFLKFDVTKRVMEAAAHLIRAQLPRVDRRLAAVDLREVFDGVWLEIQKPIRLADSVWLVLRPSGVRLGQLRGAADSIGTIVGITASPSIETGDRPAIDDVPLPPIDTMGPVQGLNVRVQGRFEYPVVSKLMTDELGGTPVTVAGRRVVIRDITVFGVGGGRLALGVRFRGAVRGLIYFVGTPRYDGKSDRITVPDLDFDASSAGLLVRGLAWLQGREVREFLRERATFPSASALEPLTQLTMDGMNRELKPGVKLWAELTGTEVLRIEPRADALYLIARAYGSAGVDLSKDLFAGR